MKEKFRMHDIILREYCLHPHFQLLSTYTREHKTKCQLISVLVFSVFFFFFNLSLSLETDTLYNINTVYYCMQHASRSSIVLHHKKSHPLSPLSITKQHIPR